MLPRCNTIHIYCDGSVNGNKAGCGVVVREYYENDISVDATLSKRLEDETSSTAAELHAIHEGLKMVVNKIKDIFVFVDSQSALLALNSKTPSSSEVVVLCKGLVCRLQEKGLNVKFFWVPSHIGILLNEVADNLAKEATRKPSIDIETSMSLNRIKRGMRIKREVWGTEKAIKVLEEGRVSMGHYLFVTENTKVTYGKVLSKVDTFVMRMRLGYNYCWQYMDGDGIHCRLCGAAYSHTLHHYMLECDNLREFRNVSINNVTEQVCFVLNNNFTKRIVNRFPRFSWNR
ncbi:uncharacterized protein LOC135198990 [Macrobrachium nipponense]|uniref:uncharacterized protein LOC135198990 n=1 Tax=Macrobrachium nipponense TaxID=159736 RepID=UPI0030C8D02C